MIWLKKSWEWLKKNWKYVITFGIPVLFSFILSLLRSNRSLENKVELKNKELKLKDDLKKLEDDLEAKSNDQLVRDLEKADKSHKQKLASIEKEKEEKITSIDTPEKATQAIKDALGE